MIKKIQLKLYIFLTMLGIFTSYNAQSWVIWDNLGDGTTAGASTIGVGSATSNPITGKVTVVPSFGAAAGKLNIFSAGSGLIQPPSGLYNNFAGASISNNVLKLESSQYANELVSITFNFEKEVIIEDLVVTDLDKNIKTSIFDNSQEWDDSFDITLDNGATFTSVSYGVSNGGNIAQGYAGATITTSSFDAGTYRSSDSRGSEWIRWVKSSAPTKTIKITFKLPNDLPRTRAAMSYYAIKVSSANLIDAVDDNFGVVSSGGKTGSVFANDKSSDGSVPTSLNTDVSLVNLGGLTGATINPDGTINIPANAAAGNYVLTYRICSPKGQTTNCDTATVTLVVPNQTDAVDDNFGVVSSGGKTGSVFANDKSSDGSVPTSLNTDVSLVNLGGLTGATINPDGTINIPANAAAGNYVLTYRICSPKGQTTNCDTATVTLVVPNQTDAVDDNFGVVSSGGKTGSVFANDKSSDGSVPTSLNTDVSLVNLGGLTGATINPDGTINIPANAAAGNYVLTYRICSPKGQTTNCDTATVTLVVPNQTDAVDDNFGVVSSGGKTGSVFANDKSSDGSVPTSLNTDVSLVNLGGLTGATINPDGTINIPANAAAGNYVLTYRICSPKGQTTNCDTATVTLVVPNQTDAVDDNFGVVSSGGKTGSVFANDKSSDGSVPTSLNTDVSLVNLGGLTGATINPDGTINIPANAAAGNYVLTYRICSPKGQTTNCDTATVTLSIAASKCYNSPTDNSSSVPVNHGVTVLGRAGVDNGNWPMIRNSAYTVLEGKTKGFVLTRNSNPEGTIVNPVVGMMVFDTDENSGKGCLKIYTGSGVGEGWKCFNTQTCP